MKNDNAFQELDEQTSDVVVEDAGSQPAFDAPPKGHRIRVDGADLEQKPGETDVAFANRQREYETAPDPFSPTGRKKAKIYLYDYEVKCIGKNKVAPARINGVPAAPDALREFMILRDIPFAGPYRFRAFPVPGSKRDAGDAGYASNHVPDEVRQRRANVYA